MPDMVYLTHIPLRCPDSAYSSRKNSNEPPQTADSSTTSQICEEKLLKRERCQDGENCGAAVTKAQQWRALLATSLQAFWVVGK
jgi:hypothetical protein